MNSSNSLIKSGGDFSEPTGLSLFSDDQQGADVELEVHQLGQRFRMNPDDSPILIVGRAVNCDITLPDPLVSFRHAYFQLVGGQVHCVDLASRTGTHWTSECRRSGWLLPGEPVTIGPYTISQTSPHPAPPGLNTINLFSQKSRACYCARDVELTFLNSRNDFDGCKCLSLTEPVTLLGNSRRCRLWIDHPSISRVHCSLMVTPTGLWISDLLGKGGTRVNGERIAFRLLEQDDEICIGEFRFLVNYADESGSEPLAIGEHPVADAPASLGPSSGCSEDFVLSLMDRFTTMQQQMSAMSQQQMMFMAQLVGSMHQNHHEVVQQELARINRLGEQIQQLQSQVQASDRTPAEPVRSLSHTSDSPQMPPLQIPLADSKNLPDFTAEVTSAQSPATPPDVPAASVESGESPNPTAEPECRAPQRHAPQDVQSHSQLIERMAALEQERSSRWKKIMRIVTGSGPS